MKKIKSSDIANYIFCPASWWIGITEGVKITKTMSKEEKNHQFITKNQTKIKLIHMCIIIIIGIITALIIYRFFEWI